MPAPVATALLSLATLCLATLTSLGQAPAAPAATGASELAPRDFGWWREARFGLFIHWGPAALTGKEISWSRQETGVETYDALARQFNPTRFDAEAWVAVAQSAGMRYIVLTAKHHDGFMLWATETDPHHIMNTPFGRDVVSELAAAAKKAGIPFGLYFSPGDWKDADCRHPENNPRFVARMHAQLTELLTRYGKIPLVWIDFDGRPNPSAPQETATLIRTLQPGVLLTNRLEALHPDESHGRIGPWGDYATPEQRIGSYCDTVPWETCMTIADQWNWKPNDRLKPLACCLRTLVSTVGGDGNLLFNVGPRPDGEIEPDQIARLKEMGAWLARHGEAIYGTRGGPYAPTADYAATRTAEAIYVHLFGAPALSPALPALSARVRSATLLDGTPVPFTQTDAALHLPPPADRLDAEITVVKLLIEGAPLELAPIYSPSTSGSLTYRRPAQVSSSVAPHFMHDPQAALDDNPDTYWAPGRNESVAAGLIGTGPEIWLQPDHELWLREGWLTVDLVRPVPVRRAVLREKTGGGRQTRPVTSWKIEYTDEAGAWRAAARGETIGARLEVDFPEPVTARTFRLSVSAGGRFAITEFELH